MSDILSTKPWLKSYETHVPADVDTKEFQSVAHVIESACDKYSDLPAFHNLGKTISYSELDSLTAAFGDFLQHHLKLEKNSRVALMMPNILQYPIALFGALRAGYTIVNVNPLYTARELEHQLNDSGATTIIIFENACSTLEKILHKTKVRNVITTQIGDMLPFPKSLIVNSVIKYVKKMVPSWSIPSSIKFCAALKQGESSKLERPSISHSDVAFLQYTGGTTGVSKGAVLTHGNIVANIIQAKTWISGHLEVGKEIIITPLPLYHIFSLTANCLVYSCVGALNVLITNPRDAAGFVKELRKWKFTAFTGLNTLFNMLSNNVEFSSVNFDSLKLTLGGGMAVQKAVAERWKKITGCPIIEAYGLTETSPAACINPFSIKEYSGYIGVPISSTTVTIRDDNGKDMKFDEVGEICIKGPQVMQGYYNRPDETAKVMSKDGFFMTGDMGYMTKDGFIKIVDRKKDMILVSGFNVYPNEVEDVVATNPKVLECAAVAAPNEHSGEVVKVFIVKKDPSLTESEVIQFCKENLTGYKVPKIVVFKKELPKTPVGKILRRELRDQG